MKYRIFYREFFRYGVRPLTKIVEATSDERAVVVYREFQKNPGNRSFFRRLFYDYSFDGLVRIDQEEITTKIL